MHAHEQWIETGAEGHPLRLIELLGCLDRPVQALQRDAPVEPGVDLFFGIVLEKRDVLLIDGDRLLVAPLRRVRYAEVAQCDHEPARVIRLACESSALDIRVDRLRGVAAQRERPPTVDGRTCGERREARARGQPARLVERAHAHGVLTRTHLRDTALQHLLDV